MFCREELLSLRDLNYAILVSNGHDVRLKSRLTGHEWIIISPYDGSSCEILHRHSAGSPFHHQQGRYGSLSSALDYIRQHDTWFCEKSAAGKSGLQKKHRPGKYVNIRYEERCGPEVNIRSPGGSHRDISE